MVKITTIGGEVDIAEWPISYSELIKNNLLYLEPELCMQILLSVAKTMNLTLTENVVSNMLTIYQTENRIDETLAKQLIDSLWSDYKDKGLGDTFEQCWMAVKHKFEEAKKENLRFQPVIKAPKEQLLLRLLDKSDDSE